MNNLLVLFVVLPFCTAILLIFLRKYRRMQRAISVISTLVLWLASFYLLFQVRANGIQILRLGDWEVPYAIVFVGDLLSCIMLILSTTTGLFCLIYSIFSIGAVRERFYFYPLYQILLMGLNGAFLTGDLFNLFVFFELMLLSSYVLMTLGAGKAQLRESLKYLVLNIIGGTMFVSSLGLLYGWFGTLNMAHLSVRIAQQGMDHPIALTMACFLLIIFGMKAAIFPLYYWLPDSYPEAPRGPAALFSGMLTKVGVYALFRVFTLIFVTEDGTVHRSVAHSAILHLAAWTMIIGVLGAIAKNRMRSILSFHIISQIGYMIMALGIYTPLAVAGGIFYIVHHIIVKCTLFLVGGIVENNSGTGHLKKLGSYLSHYPFVAFLFLSAALSLAGVPPLSGFYGKFLIVLEGLDRGLYGYVVVSMITSILTLFSMMKIWNYVFWEENGKSLEKPPTPANYRGMALATLGLVCCSLTIGLYSEPFMVLAKQAAEQVMNPQLYQQAVGVTTP